MALGIRIIGASRAGLTLAGAAARAGLRGEGLWSRGGPGGGGADPAAFGQRSITFAELSVPGADLLLVAVSDDAIAATAVRLAEQAEALRRHDILVVHLSGSLDLSVLAPLAARGVAVASLHPMRSFPDRDPQADLRGVFFALERGSDRPERLAAFVAALGGRCFEIAAAGKARHHLAASLASNLLVVLLDEIADLGREAGGGVQGREAYLSLARAALDSWLAKGPSALTGPWTRGDVGTLGRHLDLLADRPALRALYVAGLRAALARRPELPGREALLGVIAARFGFHGADDSV